MNGGFKMDDFEKLPEVGQLLSKVGWKDKLSAMVEAEVLDWSNKQLEDAGCAVISFLMELGLMRNVKKLKLYDNRIGDIGVTAIANVIKPTTENPMGALANLGELWLNDNQMSDAGMIALA